MQSMFEGKLKKMKQKNKQMFKKAIEDHIKGGNNVIDQNSQDSSVDFEPTQAQAPQAIEASIPTKHSNNNFQSVTDILPKRNSVATEA